MTDKTLIIVAGLSSSGKTTLVRHFMAGRLEPFSKLFNIHPVSCDYIELFRRHGEIHLSAKHLIVHYDITNLYSRKQFRYMDELFNHHPTVKVLVLQSSCFILKWRQLYRFIAYLLRINNWRDSQYQRSLRLMVDRLFNKTSCRQSRMKQEMFMKEILQRNPDAVYCIKTNDVFGDTRQIMARRLQTVLDETEHRLTTSP